MLPQSFIDQIKETVNMVTLAEEYTDLRKDGKVYIGLCPHPNHPDKNPSFRVWENDNSWACMVCHNGRKDLEEEVYGSDSIAFIQWIEGLSFPKAAIYLANKYKIPVPTDENLKAYKRNNALAKSYELSLKGDALKYMLNRGFTKEDLKEWGVGYNGERVTFPLYDRYRNVLSFSSRLLVVPEGCNKKYVNGATTKIFNKSNYLYGIHNYDDKFKEIRITEGVTDVMLATKHGAKNVMASLGTAFTKSHAQLLKHYKCVPVFILDNDEAGLKAIKKASKLMNEIGVYCKILILPEGKDLADMALELGELLEDYIQENAITYGNYLILEKLEEFKQEELKLELNYKAKVNELRLKSYPDLASIISLVPTVSEKKILKDYIKSEFGMNI